MNGAVVLLIEHWWFAVCGEIGIPGIRIAEEKI